MTLLSRVEALTGADRALYDKRGIPMERGDVVKVFHFIGARRKRHYMYKQCLGFATYPNGTQEYLFFSHLNFNDNIGSSNGPYHERADGRVMTDYEIVHSIACDEDRRPRLAVLRAKEGT